jgi:hypothetical protein
MPKQEPTVVFTGGPIEAGLLQGKLADAGVESYLMNEYMGTLGTSAIGVKVAVNSDDFEQAMPVVNSFIEAAQFDAIDTIDESVE